jgi:signal transduction histidine kinase
MSITELVGMVVQNARTLAEANGVHLKTRICIDRMLSSRFADLILLVLENLVQNGIEATPPGKIVELSVTNGAGAINFEVCDQGTGLPPGTESRLFMPCTSAKKRGAGIGLAISKQLAQSLDAKLELTGNSAAGCTFRLVVPEQSP